MFKKIIIVLVLFLLILLIVLILSLNLFIFHPKGIGPFRIKEEQTQDTDETFKAELERFKALPYVSWSEEKVEEELQGVIKYNVDKACPGYNLYTSKDKNSYLIDMTGKIMHSWHSPIQDKWKLIEPLNDGGLIAISSNQYVCRVTKDSQVLWRYKPIGAHHDLAVLPDNTYLVIADESEIYKAKNVKFNSILHISESGQILNRWSTYENFNALKKLHNPTPLNIEIANKDDFDYYHLNTIEIIPENTLGQKDDRFKKGNYLICLRNVNLILILDKDLKEILWSWGKDVLDWPHTPTMLENGNILIFDNGAHKNYSRVIEIDPIKEEIVWEYKADPPDSFYSCLQGSCQRLPNENTLICESDIGRVFEVTPQGEIVWEFFIPETKEGKRPVVTKMIRLTKEEVEKWLSID